MKSAKRQREKGASDTDEPERTSAKKSKTQVSVRRVSRGDDRVCLYVTPNPHPFCLRS